MRQPDSRSSRKEPRWRGWSLSRELAIPARIDPWLRDRGSLTAHVRSACGERRFRVRVLRQGWERPLRSEAERLGVRQGAVAVVREVQLLCDEQPWVFARTLIPATSLSGPARRLTRLGNRPLGAVLFADRQVRRGDTEVARLRPGERLYQAATAGLVPAPAAIWGRRTLFYMAGQPLLVNELFLPQIPESVL